MFLMAFASAVETIDLTASYFVPDPLIDRTLLEARRRGVRVRILVPGTHIDSEVVRLSSRSGWGPLLDAGVEIFEYQPTMMHAKALIVDRLLVSVGSTNVDLRSFQLNDEASLNVYDRGVRRADDRGVRGRPGQGGALHGRTVAPPAVDREVPRDGGPADPLAAVSLPVTLRRAVPATIALRTPRPPRHDACAGDRGRGARRRGHRRAARARALRRDRPQRHGARRRRNAALPRRRRHRRRVDRARRRPGRGPGRGRDRRHRALRRARLHQHPQPRDARRTGHGRQHAHPGRHDRDRERRRQRPARPRRRSWPARRRAAWR